MVCNNHVQGLYRQLVAIGWRSSACRFASCPFLCSSAKRGVFAGYLGGDFVLPNARRNQATRPRRRSQPPTCCRPAAAPLPLARRWPDRLSEPFGGPQCGDDPMPGVVRGALAASTTTTRSAIRPTIGSSAGQPCAGRMRTACMASVQILCRRSLGFCARPRSAIVAAVCGGLRVSPPSSAD